MKDRTLKSRQMAKDCQKHLLDIQRDISRIPFGSLKRMEHFVYWKPKLEFLSGQIRGLVSSIEIWELDE